MNILFTGKGGKAGAWAIRGDQLGKALGADVIANALDVAAYDVVVMVKRARLDAADRCHRADVPLVWDVLDHYPQPDSNTWGRAACMAWLQGQIRSIRPNAIVAATKVMESDIREVFGGPVLYLPHHCRPEIERNPIREEVRTVGYEGGHQHLGRWREIMMAECRRRGWAWLENPASLAQLDIVVALRHADGYAPRHWKSGVKWANAAGSGTPFIACPEAGYREQACGVERFVEDDAGLARALDALTPVRERERCAGWMRTAAPSLESAARTYRTWLETIHA